MTAPPPRVGIGGSATDNDSVSSEAVEQAVLDRIDSGTVVTTAAELVGLPSLSGAEDVAQEQVARMLRRVGADVEIWRADVGRLAASPWFSAEFDRIDPLCVVGRFGSDQGPTLLVDGHIDVVPPGDPSRWTNPPFTPMVRDGRLFGRGACDMKGGLAAAICAMEALRAARVRLRGSVLLASVFGEEDGGSGTLAILDHGIRADACIIAEPTELAIAPAVAGALSFRIRVTGQSAHGALREEGVSAIERLPFVQRALLALEERRNARSHDPLFGWLRRPFSICTGRVAGGDWPSSEADWLTLEGRYGVAPGEDLDTARHELEDAVLSGAAGDAWLREHPPEIEWWGGQFYPARTDVLDPIVQTTAGAVADVTGKAAEQRAMSYGCDMGLTVGMADIPTVVFGPGDIRAAHRPDEHVPVNDLVTSARALALTMVRFCGVSAS